MTGAGARAASARNPTSTSVAEQADDAAALLDALAAAPAVIIGRSYGGAVAIELALRYPDRVRALALLEGDALGLSPAASEWTKAIVDRLREVAARDGVDAVYEALIGEVLGEGAWDSFPDEVRRVLTRNGPALLAELGYVEEAMPDAAAFATIEVPALLVAASESPPEQRDMTEAMAEVLPNARAAQVAAIWSIRRRRRYSPSSRKSSKAGSRGSVTGSRLKPSRTPVADRASGRPHASLPWMRSRAGPPSRPVKAALAEARIEGPMVRPADGALRRRDQLDQVVDPGLLYTGAGVLEADVTVALVG